MPNNRQCQDSLTLHNKYGIVSIEDNKLILFKEKKE